jgi:hypothetical protein
MARDIWCFDWALKSHLLLALARGIICLASSPYCSIDLRLPSDLLEVSAQRFFREYERPDCQQDLLFKMILRVL